MNVTQTETNLVQIKNIVPECWDTLTDSQWDAIVGEQESLADQESYPGKIQVIYITANNAEMQFAASQKDQKDKKNDKDTKGDKDSKGDKDNKNDKDQKDSKNQKK